MSNSVKQQEHAEALFRASLAGEDTKECSEILLHSIEESPTRSNPGGKCLKDEAPVKRDAARAEMERTTNADDARAAELTTKYSSRLIPADVNTELERLAVKRELLKDPYTLNHNFESSSWCG